MKDDDDKESDEFIVDSKGETNDNTKSSARSPMMIKYRAGLTCVGPHRIRVQRHQQADLRLPPEIGQIEYRRHRSCSRDPSTSSPVQHRGSSSPKSGSLGCPRRGREREVHPGVRVREHHEVPRDERLSSKR